MANTDREDVVTLLWEIENFNELFSHKIESPEFLSNSLDRTRWKLCLYPESGINDDNMSLSLTRCDSLKPEEHIIVLDCELSIVEEFGNLNLASQEITQHGFIKDHCWSTCETFVSRHDVFTKRRADFIPYNVLHVRCRMWKSFDRTTLSELLISHIKIERSHFIWKISNFSGLKAYEVKEMHVKQPVSETPILSFKFYTDGTSDAAIIAIASERRFNISIWCEITALDCNGRKFESEWEQFTSSDDNPYQFPSFIKISDLLDKKTLYLPMDVLSLQVDCFFYSSDINVSPITTPNLQVCKSLRFVQDLQSMYEEGLLSDFTLCAGNRTFPVHKNILSARSPVFKAMFTTPLKEKDGKVVDIPDIDGDTLHRMLLFVYSNEMQDLDWEDAISLYFAADKYNIEDLKSITSSVLKSKLSVSNVFDILVHANLHEDQDLKSSAMEFITSHDDEIIGTEDWKKFQKKHIPLTMEIFSVLYMEMKKRLG